MTDNPEQNVRTRTEGHIFEVTLDRPKANAIDLKTSIVLGDIFKEFRDDPEMRVALITGGTQGLGYATASLLKAKGANGLMLVGRDAEKGQAAAASLTGDGCWAEFTLIDLADADGPAECAAAVDDAFGTLQSAAEWWRALNVPAAAAMRATARREPTSAADRCLGDPARAARMARGAWAGSCAPQGGSGSAAHARKGHVRVARGTRGRERRPRSGPISSLLRRSREGRGRQRMR